MKTVILYDFKGMEGPIRHVTCIACREDDLILIEKSLPQEEKERLVLEYGGTLPFVALGEGGVSNA